MRKLLFILVLFWGPSCNWDATGTWLGCDPCYKYTKDPKWQEVQKRYWEKDLEYQKALCNELNVKLEKYNDEKAVKEAFIKVVEKYKELDKIYWEKKQIEAKYYGWSFLKEKI